MSSLIEQIAREAKATFSKDVTDPDFMDSLNKFLMCVGKLQASDVKVDESVKTAPDLCKLMYPSFYIPIMETETFVIGIYIIKPGVTVPLRDRKDMHVILKAIEGSVRISAYTTVADEPSYKTAPQDVRDEAGEILQKYLIPVVKLEPLLMGEKDQPCVLGPNEGNFHEVSAVGDTATAFLEIYAAHLDLNVREPTYYKALNTAEQDAPIKTWLVETEHNVEFYCTDLSYCGPKIKL